MPHPSTEWYLDPEVPVPLRLRILWSPLTPTLVCGLSMWLTISGGLTLWRGFAWAVELTWLFLTLYNVRTKGAYLRSLYAPDDEAVARVVQKR